MTLLHIVVDVPDGVDNPMEVAEQYSAWGVRPVSAAWDMAQVPPEPVGPMTVRAVAILSDHADKASGLLLPGPFGTFQLAQHYRGRASERHGLVTYDPPDEYDHATFSGRIDGGYTMLVAGTLADAAARLADMLVDLP